MADELKRVGLVFKADGTADFTKTLSQVNALTKENYQSFKLAQSQYDKNTSSVQKLKNSQEYLAKNTELYSDKVKILEEQLDQLENAEERNETAIAKKKAELDRAKQTLGNYEKQLKTVNAELESGSAQLKEYAEKVESVSKKASEVGKSMTKNVTAPIVAVGTSSMVAWTEIDEAYDNIILKTGATGDALDGLQDSFDNVYGSFPFDSQEVSEAIGEVNTRFALTGKELEDLSAYMLQYANITGSDVTSATAQAQRVQDQWGLSLEETKNALGLVAYQSQATGISTETLMENVTKNSSAFKEMGLSITESINLLAQFEANGLDAEQMVTGLKKASQAYAKEGKSMNEGLQELILGLQDSTTYQEYYSEAVEMFGNKNALAFATACKEGKISLDDLSGYLEDYADVVTDTFEGTLDPVDDFKVAMNNLKVAGAELGSAIQGALAPAFSKIAELAKSLADWFKSLNPVVKEIIATVGMLVASIGPLLVVFGAIGSQVSKAISMFANLKLQLFMGEGAISSLATAFGSLSAPMLAVGALVGVIVASVVDLWNTSESFRDSVTSIVSEIGSMIQNLYDSILSPIIEAIKTIISSLWTDCIQPVYEQIKTVVEGAMSTMSELFAVISPIINQIVSLMGNVLSGTLTTVVLPIFQTVFGAISALLQNVILPVFNVVFNTIKSVVSTCFNAIQSVYNSVLKPCFDAINSVVSKVKEVFTSCFGSMENKSTSVFGSIASSASSKMSSVWSAVSSAVSKLKSAFNFSWKLPSLKLPHITVSGGFSLKPLRVPRFGISWYAKAMDTPYLLNSATLFGMANGKFLGGGEKGSEVIYGRNALMNDIREASNADNSEELNKVINLLSNIYDVLKGGNQMVLDTGALVGEIAPQIDEALGNIRKWKG